MAPSRSMTTAPRLTRRSFLETAALGAAVVGGVGARADGMIIDRRWEVVRDAAASGVIGAVATASAIVPLDGRPAHVRFGVRVPAAIADALDGLLETMSGDAPVDVRTAEHSATQSFSLSCELGAGRRIALAGARADAALTAVVRGAAGAIYVNGGSIAIESRGAWRELAY